MSQRSRWLDNSNRFNSIKNETLVDFANRFNRFTEKIRFKIKIRSRLGHLAIVRNNADQQIQIHSISLMCMIKNRLFRQKILKHQSDWWQKHSAVQIQDVDFPDFNF